MGGLSLLAPRRVRIGGRPYVRVPGLDTRPDPATAHLAVPLARMLVRHPGALWDVGDGAMLLSLLALDPARAYAAFAPDPAVAAPLAAFIGRNGLAQARVLAVALGAGPGMGPLPGGAVLAAITTGDLADGALGGGRLGVIRVARGPVAEVLHGLTGVLRRDRPALILPAPVDRADADAARALLGALGYGLSRLTLTGDAEPTAALDPGPAPDRWTSTDFLAEPVNPAPRPTPS